MYKLDSVRNFGILLSNVRCLLMPVIVVFSTPMVQSLPEASMVGLATDGVNKKCCSKVSSANLGL